MSVAASRATTNQWTGASGDNLWTNSANWSLGTLPNSTHDVVIPGTTNEVLLNDTAQVASLQLGSSGNATLNISGGSLTCTSNSLVYSNGVLQLAGTLTMYSSPFAPQSFSVDGTINWASGLLGCGGELGMQIRPSGNINITGSATKTFGGRLRNNGVISCYATNLDGDTSACIYNTNLFILYSNISLTAASPTSPAMRNFGTLLIPAGSGTRTLDTAWAFENLGTIKVETNAVLEVRPQWFNAVWFEEGTVLDGPGLIRLPSPNYNPGVRCTGLITLNTTLDAIAGLVSFGHSTWTGAGVLKMQGFISDVTFGPGFQVEATTSGQITINGNCTNQGVIRWLEPGQLLWRDGSTFYNEGQFLIQTNCALESGFYGQNGSFINTGTILTPANSGVLSFSVNSWYFTNRGTIKAETNSTLEFRPQWGDPGNIHVALEDGTMFDGPGLIRFPYTGYFFSWNGDTTLSTTLEYEGLGIYGKPVWGGPGLFRWKRGGMSDFTFGPDFHVEMTSGDSKSFGGNCTNWGNVRWLASGASWHFSTGSTFNNYGQFIIEANGDWYTFSDPPGSFSNFGSMELQQGTLSISTPFSASPSGTLKVAIGGTAPGTGFGHLSFVDNPPVFAGIAPFAGTLNVALTNGFIPVAGNSFTIANYVSYTGTFSSNSFPALSPGLEWQVNYGATALTFSVVSGVSVTNAIRLLDGNFAFQIAGPAGGSAMVQMTTNLNNPIVWTNLATNSPFTGTYNFTDTQATNFPRRFYRALIVP